ncbi:hypothetical protein M2401_006360 [Pseudomonas sp. JUb42]|uniref:YfjI family protein n=1 Tax=Pseudomonas sp. JUb42 TaxID=2940611 RepID=UPI002166F264|nr:YfjI family protein [Pseudomonas sp. JUb42]MCS3472595.1 hypothetical protein [Pseudomonas sp. JUb42]
MTLADIDFPMVLPFPLLAAAIDEVQNTVKAPRSLILSTALSAIAVAIQGLFDVRKPNGQQVPLSLMLMTIADSGERKSTVDKVFFRAVREFEKKQKLIYDYAIKEWNYELKILDVKINRIFGLIKSKTAVEESSEYEENRAKFLENSKPLKPRLFKLLYDDATPEALFLGLYRDLPTAGLISSEGGSILKGRALGDLPKHNAIWSGDQITIDRKKAESYTITDARLTVSIMIQESAFLSYMETRGEQSRGSGLWARFLVCKPESTQGSRMMSNVTMSSEHCDRFSERLLELLEPNIELLENPNRPKAVIKFSPEAGEAWIAMFNRIEQAIRTGMHYSEAGDHASKLADNIARVAALIHCFEGFEGDISLETVNMANSLCIYYSDEFMKIFVPPPQDEVNGYELYTWLLKNLQQGHMMTKNNIRQKAPSKLRSKDIINSALEFLVQQNKIYVGVVNKTQYVSFSRIY